MTRLSDVELIHRVVAGDAEASDLFVARFTRLIWWVLVHEKRLDNESASEVYQTVFLRLWRDNYRSLRNWSGEGDFASYLTQIVRHLVVDLQRGRRPELHEPLSDPDEPGQEPQTPEVNADEIAWVEQQRGLLDDAVAALDPPDRRLYEMRFVEEQSYREISSTLGITVNNVGVRISRLSERLRSAVAEQIAPNAENHATGVRSSSPDASPE